MLDECSRKINNLESFNKIAHISWSTIVIGGVKRKKYGFRAELLDFPKDQKERDYDEYTCNFDDYFEPLEKYSGHHTGKNYGV